MELRSNIKMLNYTRKFLLGDTAGILPFPVRPQKPVPAGKRPVPLPRSSPEEQGVPPDALDALYRGLAGVPQAGPHACLVLRHGAVVAEGHWAPYSARRWHVTHSLCKSVTGTAIGMLIDEGALSLDERVCDIFPEKCSLLTNRRMRAVTVRHLVTMTSGVNFKEAGAVLESDWVKGFFDADVLFEPGSAFDYNSMNSYMLSAIVKRKTGLGLCQYLRPRLFEPLGFGDVAWETCPHGIEKGGWGLYVYLEDMAKLGQLYLQNGVWEQGGQKRRLLSSAWVAAATKPDTVHENGEEYGYQLWPHSADHTYMFNGMFGQYVIVAPDLALVVAVNAGAGNLFTRSESYEVVQAFLGAVAAAPPGPLPADENARRRLSHTLGRLAFGEAVPPPPAPPQKPPLAARLRALFAPRAAAQPAPGPIPADVMPRLRTAYRMEKNHAGLLPIILGCMNDCYAGGVEQIAFDTAGGQLSLLWTEGGAIHHVPVGFDRPAESQVDIGGNVFAVGVKGRFTTNEDDEPVLKLTVCFLESSSTRLLKFIFAADGGLVLRLDEAPALALAMQSLAGTLNSQGQQQSALELFKDLDYLHYLVERVCTPTLHSAPPAQTQG